MFLLVFPFGLQQTRNRDPRASPGTHAKILFESLRRDGLQVFDQLAMRVADKRQQFIEVLASVFCHQLGVVGFPVLVVTGVEFGQFPRLDILGGGQVGKVPAGQVGEQIFD
jgi:hypothetical protein